jgi:hypothetical protein
MNLMVPGVRGANISMHITLSSYELFMCLIPDSFASASHKKSRSPPNVGSFGGVHDKNTSNTDSWEREHEELESEAGFK